MTTHWYEPKARARRARVWLHVMTIFGLALALGGCAAPPTQGADGREPVGQAAEALCPTLSLSSSAGLIVPSGTVVTLTASGSCSSPTSLEWWLSGPSTGNKFTDVQPYSSSTTYTWDTTGLASGRYDIEVWDGPVPFYTDIYIFVEPPGVPGPCTAVTLAASPASPQPAGSTITWTATPTCPGTPNYEFWLQAPGGAYEIVQPYGLSPTFTWNVADQPLGTYNVQVWIEDTEGADTYDVATSGSFVVTQGPVCSHTLLSYTPTGAVSAGTMLTLMATAACTNNSPEFTFSYKSTGAPVVLGQIGSAWTTGPVVWDTSGFSGTFDLTVATRAHDSGSAHGQVSVTTPVLITPSAPCFDGTLSASPSGSAVMGTPVTLTGGATCAQTAEYEFWMLPPGGDWSIVRAYGPGDTYAFDTTVAAGVYDFEVWVRTINTTVSYDTYYDMTYTVDTATPCTPGGLAFSPSGGSAQIGTAVTLSASASCGGTPEYEYWMQPPGGSWSIVQPYGASSTYAWTTTALTAGLYDFEVWVRDEGSSSAYDFAIDRTYTLWANAPCTGGALAFSPTTGPPGTTVTLTGSATCGGTAEYEFWMQPPGGSWSIVQAYGASSTYTWTTTGLASGTYDFEVWVRDQGSLVSFDTYQDETYLLQ